MDNKIWYVICDKLYKFDTKYYSCLFKDIRSSLFYEKNNKIEINSNKNLIDYFVFITNYLNETMIQPRNLFENNIEFKYKIPLENDLEFDYLIDNYCEQLDLFLNNIKKPFEELCINFNNQIENILYNIDISKIKFDIVFLKYTMLIVSNYKEIYLLYELIIRYYSKIWINLVDFEYDNYPEDTILNEFGELIFGEYKRLNSITINEQNINENDIKNFFENCCNKYYFQKQIEKKNDLLYKI